jgi:putative ABC transport system substrate-binding protein
LALTSLFAGLAAAVLLLAAPLAAQTQQAGRVYRVGFITPLSAAPEPPTLRAFRQGLHELGYVEGQNVLIEARSSEGRSERFPVLLGELLRLRVDVLLAGSTPGAVAAKKATATVPIVFAGVYDPIAPGIVASLARPGGNVTGVTVAIGGVGFSGKWLELLKEAVPRVSHVAVLSNPAEPLSAQWVGELRLAAQTLNVKLDVLEAENIAKLERALAAISASSAQGMVVTAAPLFAANRVKIAQFAATKHLPAVHFSKLFTEAGGLMSYGGSLEDSYRRAATYVDKILRGAKPADLPVEQPTRFELVINVTAARALGLTIPPSLLLRADQLID